MSLAESSRIAVALCTYQRPYFLAAALEGILNQSFQPKVIYIWDNNSEEDRIQTAGIIERIRQKTSVKIIHCFDDTLHNSGGAGGFASVLERIRDDVDSDYCWIMDDDAYPARDALAQLLKKMQEGADFSASQVIWKDGSRHLMNRVRSTNSAGTQQNIRAASFVSVLFKTTLLREYGLPLREYFLWNDDTEFTLRLLKHVTGFYAKESICLHRTAENTVVFNAPLDRLYFYVRNTLWMLRGSNCLHVEERIPQIMRFALTVFMAFWQQSQKASAIKKITRAVMHGLWKDVPRPQGSRFYSS